MLLLPKPTPSFENGTAPAPKRGNWRWFILERCGNRHGESALISDRTGAVNVQSRQLQAPAPQTLIVLDQEGHVRNLAVIRGDVLRHAMLVTRGNKSKASAALCIPRSTFYRWLEETS